MAYVPEIRMNAVQSVWIMPLMSKSRFESKESAESFAQWVTKQWYGAASSRAVEVEESPSKESNEAKPIFKQQALSLDAESAIEDCKHQAERKRKIRRVVKELGAF